MSEINLKKIVEELGLEIKTCEEQLATTNVTGGYVSDLMSDVIANSKEGQIWVTIQAHQNIIAVATLRELAGIIIANNKKPEEETLERAVHEGIPILLSKLTAFEISGRLYQMGVHGE